MMAKLSGYMVPELRREREASALNLTELTEFIDGGEMITEKRKRVCESLVYNLFIMLPKLHSIYSLNLFRPASC